MTAASDEEPMPKPGSLHLLPASEVRTGDLMENADGIFRPLMNIEKQYGRLYFLFRDARDTRTALVDDLVMVGR